MTGEFPAQRASNAENVSIWWRHHIHIAYQHHRVGLRSSLLSSIQLYQPNMIWSHVSADEVCNTIRNSNNLIYDTLISIFWQIWRGHLNLLAITLSVQNIVLANSKELTNIRITGMGILAISGEFPAQKASNAESVFLCYMNTIPTILYDPHYDVTVIHTLNLGHTLLTLKSVWRKAFSRKIGCDWLML